MTADSVPAPMVQLSAEAVEKLREALPFYWPLYHAAKRLLAVVDAATPAASVPANVNELCESIAQEIERIPTADPRYDGTINRHPYDLIHDAARIARSAAAAEQADKGEAADTPHDEGPIVITREELLSEVAPAAPPEPLCRCGHDRDSHRYTYQDSCGFGGTNGITPCDCKCWHPARVPVNDEAEAVKAFEDELDAHIAESMKDPEYAAADALHREAEASWRNWVPSMFADDENMHTAYVSGYKDAGFRAARQEDA